jgi:hypothetical protein
VSKKAKYSGKRAELRLTVWLRACVVTPYNPARSGSRMTFSPRIPGGQRGRGVDERHFGMCGEELSTFGTHRWGLSSIGGT